MTAVLQWFELFYYITFIVLTLLIVIYTVKNYRNQKKQPPKLIARINYSFLEKADDKIPVVLDIINSGDYVVERVYIKFALRHKAPELLDCINFIAPKETFRYYLGIWTESKVCLFNNREIKLQDPLDFDYFKLETQGTNIILTIKGDEILPTQDFSLADKNR